MPRSLYARLIHKFDPNRGPSRRDVLRASLAAGTAALLSGCVTGGKPTATGGSKKRVLIVGAGFSGLAAAHELTEAGHEAIVFDGRNRLGGRVVSFGDFVPGKNVEGGGELIGSNHPTWVAYSDKFKLPFIDVTEEENATFPLVLNGRVLPKDDVQALFEQMDAAYSLVTKDAAAVNVDAPWRTPNAAALDARATGGWIQALDVSPLAKDAIAAELTADNGQNAWSQSYLGNLAQVAGGGGETYWTQSEVYRCKGGNQQLATRLAENLTNLNLSTPVISIEVTDKSARVTTAHGTVYEGDYVLLTVPPSTWGKLNITPRLPSILAPQMGTNLKYLARVKSTFWRTNKLAPDSLTDGPVSMTWHGTDNQGDEGEFSFHCFSGGEHADACRAFPAAERDARYAALLEQMYPGFKAAFVQSRFMSWPDDPWTLAGYSFPAPGQVTRLGPILDRGFGRLQFAGEHTCYKFVGYMEGALSSGVRAAKKLAAL
jgi:monoamine oxidase